jgi:pimeloyl-ACP methyl ester carboxylesterase
MITVFHRLNQNSKKMLCGLGAFVPGLWGGLAYRRFCTPHLSRHRSPDHDLLVERARFHLRDARLERVATNVGDLQAYVFDPEPPGANASVLMVHGWTGEASFMSAFAEHLRRRGFRTVLFDFPAHGKSTGKRTSLIACAHAVREVAEAVGPIHFVVAHSLGGLAALLAGGGGQPMPYPYPFMAFVLVSVPNQFSMVTAGFGAEQGLSPAAQLSYERRLERLAHCRIADFTGRNLLAATNRPALILHARDDAEVPFENAEQIAEFGASTELQAFDGLGHRKILYAPPVVRAATTYLTRQRRLPARPAFTQVANITCRREQQS